MPAPDPETVVETASDAAEELVFTEYDTSAVRDLDVTVRFEDDVLEVDVYLNAGGDPNEQRVATAAVEAAHRAVEAIFDSAREG